MARPSALLRACLALLWAGAAWAACSNVLVPSYPLPKLASGWQAQLVLKGLRKPRTVLFDDSGALLIVQSGKGITRTTFADGGDTCLTAGEEKLLIPNDKLNHGLALSLDGKTLYASTVSSVLSWSYDSATGTVETTSPRILIDNMSNNDHTTRTLLISRASPGWLLVSRGSDENYDVDAQEVSSGLSQIRAFNISALGPSSRPYDFNRNGIVLGYGLRNSVGLAEVPTGVGSGSGNVFSVENSVDQAVRDNVDVHEDNPGEELNLHGTVSGVANGGPRQPPNYGYPTCFALWDASHIPRNGGLRTGDQVGMSLNQTVTDEYCRNSTVAPRLTLPAHTAPLDIKFARDGATAYITFHGSWDRSSPVGYKLASLSFSNGEPTAPADSRDALVDVMSTPDLSVCPDKCFRPVGLAWDAKDRLFMSSDTTGEVFVLVRKGGSGTFVTSAASRMGSRVVLDALAVAAVVAISSVVW